MKQFLKYIQFLYPQSDKRRHFIVGFLIGFIAGVIGFIAHIDVLSTVIFMIGTVGVAGFGFELFSKYTGWGVCDWDDAWATLFGGIPSISVLVLYLL